MARLFGWFLVLVLLCGAPKAVLAQNILDALLGQGKGNTQLQIKTPEAKLLAAAQARLKEVIKSIEAHRKKAKERATTWEKEARAHRNTITKYQAKAVVSDWRDSIELMQMRASLVAAAERSVNMISQLQAATASREQNLLSLRDTLQNYIKTRETIEKIIEEHYVTPKQREKLRVDLAKIQSKITENRKTLADSKAQQQQLSNEYETNQKKLDLARRQLVQSVVQQTPTKKQKPTTKAKKEKSTTRPTVAPKVRMPTEAEILQKRILR